MSVSNIEKYGMSVTEAFLMLNTTFTDNNKFEFHTSLYDQKLYGDYTIIRNGNTSFIELKTEFRYTGNLFLETWSNICYEREDYFKGNGSNIGWAKTSRADYLFYYFIDIDRIYVLKLRDIQKHLFGYFDETNKWRDGKQSSYNEVSQKKNQQKNHTRGLLAPILRLTNSGVNCISINNARARYAPHLPMFDELCEAA